MWRLPLGNRLRPEPSRELAPAIRLQFSFPVTGSSMAAATAVDTSGVCRERKGYSNTKPQAGGPDSGYTTACVSSLPRFYIARLLQVLRKLTPLIFPE